MTAEVTSAVDSAATGVGPSGADGYVHALAVLPGAEHVAVVDVAGERVLGEWGGPPGSAQALLDRARRAADPSRHGRRELEDVVSTTDAAFHLSRLVLAGPGHPESVWVAVRINRARGNLTWSRGALAGLGGPAAVPLTRPATPAGGEHEQEAAPIPRGPAVVPPPPPVSTSPSTVPAPNTAPEPNALEAPTAGVAPTAQVAPVTPVASTVELVISRPSVPAARTSPENEPEPSLPDPDRRSSFAPVITVPPPPSPVPDDGTTEEPAPMPAPVITAPPLSSHDRAVDGGPATSAGGSGETGTHDRPELPRRTPGVLLVPRPPSPPGHPPPRPPGPTASSDGRSAFRRLIHGLRRPS